MERNEAMEEFMHLRNPLDYGPYNTRVRITRTSPAHLAGWGSSGYGQQITHPHIRELTPRGSGYGRSLPHTAAGIQPTFNRPWHGDYPSGIVMESRSSRRSSSSSLAGEMLAEYLVGKSHIKSLRREHEADVASQTEARAKAEAAGVPPPPIKELPPPPSPVPVSPTHWTRQQPYAPPSDIPTPPVKSLAPPVPAPPSTGWSAPPHIPPPVTSFPPPNAGVFNNPPPPLPPLSPGGKPRMAPVFAGQSTMEEPIRGPMLAPVAGKTEKVRNKNEYRLVGTAGVSPTERGSKRRNRSAKQTM